jgi:transcriptional regulator with XRE-family HTH domain
VSLNDMDVPGFKLARRIDDFAMTTKHVLRLMRESRGLTQTELAEELNVKPAVVSRLESIRDHRRPTLATLLRVADICDYRLELSLVRDDTAKDPVAHVQTAEGWSEVDADGASVKAAAE